MFQNVRLRGTSGSVLWGYHAAAVVRSWTISFNGEKKEWRLRASLARADAFQLRQRPLLFSAPKQGGFWCFPMTEIQIGSSTLIAKLGPPEQ